jgi:hypothetical protein
VLTMPQGRSITFLMEAGSAPGIQAGLLVLWVAFLVFLIWTVRRRRKAKQELSLAEGRVTRAEDVRNILNRALAERSRFELGLPREDASRRNIPLKLFEINSERLILELPGYLNISAEWKGKIMECSFSVTVQSGNQAFYRFHSTVQDIRPAPGFPSITLTLPKWLELRQKRDHLRLEPRDRTIKELQLWPVRGEKVRPENVLAESDSSVRFLPQPESPVRILNISAGGARLELRPGMLSFPLPNLRRDGYIALSLALTGLDPGDTRSWFIIGKIRHLVQNEEGGTLEMGLLFTLAGEIDVSSSSVGPLSRIEERGVEELGTWIFHHHLELYRQKGLT